MIVNSRSALRLSACLFAGAGLAAAATAQASTVNATILADNGSLAVLELGGNYTVVGASVSGNWPTPKSFSFDVPDSARELATCRIHVIAWGDGNVAQGVMAHFAGTGGIAYTGQAGGPFTVRMSSVGHGGSTAAGLAYANNNSNAAAIINGAAGAGSNGFVSQPAVSGGIPGTWGPVALPDVEGRNQIAFLWDNRDTMANPRNYRVISTPCDRVARAVTPPQPAPHVNSWEIAGQFNPASTTTTSTFEVWSYGYTDAADCSGPVVPFRNWITKSWSGQNFRGWRRGASATDNASLPEVLQSSATTMTSPMRLAPMGLTMHPGQQGQCAVVRFTAPEAGTYRMMGRFWAQNPTAGGTNVSTSVMRNGTIVIDPAMTISAPGTPTNNPFTWTGTLAQGDTVDFRVGANGNFTSDSTGLHGYIERVTP